MTNPAPATACRRLYTVIPTLQRSLDPMTNPAPATACRRLYTVIPTFQRSLGEIQRIIIEAQDVEVTSVSGVLGCWPAGWWLVGWWLVAGWLVVGWQFRSDLKVWGLPVSAQP